MKVKNIASILAAAAIVSAASTSCSHDELDLYSGPTAMLYIQELSSFDIYGNPLGYRDHSNADFANVPPEFNTWTVSFEVKMAGEVVDYDRPYTLKVEADSTTAIEGEDYDIEQNEFTIKAGKANDMVRVRLHRTDRIKLEQIRVSFLLEPNEHFTIDIPEFKTSASWSAQTPMMDATRYYVTASEFYRCPDCWHSWGLNDYFGTYTPKKFAVLNALFGWTKDDWNAAGNSATSKVLYGRIPFCASEFERYLQKMADEGTPEREVDGSLMQPGSQYHVDYSKYEN